MITAVAALVALTTLTPLEPQAEAIVRFEIEGRGAVTVRFQRNKAPKTSAHVLDLVRQGFYNGLRFHRVDRRPRPFLAFIGDPNSRDGNLDSAEMGNRGSGKRIAYEETGLSHQIGSVGLARPQQDRNGGDSQIYFVLGPAKFLDGNYAVFGQVTEGLDVLNKLERGDRIVSARVIRD